MIRATLPVVMTPLRHGLLILTAVGILAACLAAPRMPQPPAYHAFADTRGCLGMPNCLNVLSNVPFAVVGLIGLVVTYRPRHGTDAGAWERPPYAVFFAGVALTAVGSAYYHLAPDNARLVWDRLPMTAGFGGLLAAVLAERLGPTTGRRALLPLLLAGVASVLYWYWSELRGAGDLRPYLAVQFGSLAAVLLLLTVYPARHSGTAWLVAGLGAYAVAKVVEEADAVVFAHSGVLSGHTIKHVLAAAGVACAVMMLRLRVDTRDRNE